MSPITQLLLQLTIPLALGLATTFYLRHVTRILLLDLCGTEGRANFWERTTGILLAGTPVMLVLLFGHRVEMYPLTELIRQAAMLSLTGILIAVAYLSSLIWKRVPAAPGSTKLTGQAR